MCMGAERDRFRKIKESCTNYSCNEPFWPVFQQGSGWTTSECFVEGSCRSDSPMGAPLEARNREARSNRQTEIRTQNFWLFGGRQVAGQTSPKVWSAAVGMLLGCTTWGEGRGTCDTQ